MKKGIYLIPNLLTISGMFCGFYSIIKSFNGEYYIAALAIFFATLFDLVDGKIARLTNTTSQFGMEMDSLADLLSFGLAPAILVYFWALIPMKKIGWLIAFLLVICGAMRLARSNVISKTSSDYFFIGLPITASAGFISSSVLAFYRYFPDLSINTFHPIAPIIVFFLSILMVSTVQYESLKKLNFGKRMPFKALIYSVLILYVLAIEPELSLFIGFSSYILSSIVKLIFDILFRHRNLQEEYISQENY
jgi:CDP-diacylglycerol--serine O-phosphatidyltransferase